jgi:hypothetical protein
MSDRGKNCLSLPPHPHRVWCPPKQTISGPLSPGISLWGVKLITHLGPMLTMQETVTPVSHTSSWHDY